jgi:hypothetical protein
VPTGDNSQNIEMLDYAWKFRLNLSEFIKKAVFRRVVVRNKRGGSAFHGEKRKVISPLLTYGVVGYESFYVQLGWILTF